MVAAVSVVVLAKDFRSSLGSLITSLDLQSLPSTAFELVVVDLGSTDGTLERLRQLSTRRPNVRLLELGSTGDGHRGSPTAVDPAVWLAGCTGEYVLRLRPDQELFPEALERLYAEAREKDADAVAARVSQQHAGLVKLFTEDHAEVDSTLLPESLASAAVLVRRSLLEAAAAPGSDGLPAATRVAVLASYPVLRQPAEPGVKPGPTRSLRQDQPSASWIDSSLRLTVSGVVSTGEALEADLSDARPTALVRSVSTGLSYLLPTVEGAVTGGYGSEWRWDITVDLDVLTAALGAPLGNGLWEVDLHLVGGNGTPPVPTTVAWTLCPPAILDGTIVVPSPTVAPTLQLDVGPTTWHLIRNADPGQGTVTETATGSRLVLQLPSVHVSGTASVPGQVALDTLRLRAQIVTNGTDARLESLVSGLYGSPHLSAAFGETPMKPTGLGFDISGLGAFVVTKAKPKPPKPGAAKAPAKKAPPKKAPAKKPAAEDPATKKAPAPKAPPAPPSTVQKARRSLPRSLDPVVKRIAANPLARRIYRKAIRK